MRRGCGHGEIRAPCSGSRHAVAIPPGATAAYSVLPGPEGMHPAPAFGGSSLRLPVPFWRGEQRPASGQLVASAQCYRAPGYLTPCRGGAAGRSKSWRPGQYVLRGSGAACLGFIEPIRIYWDRYCRLATPRTAPHRGSATPRTRRRDASAAPQNKRLAFREMIFCQGVDNRCAASCRRSGLTRPGEATRRPAPPPSHTVPATGGPHWRPHALIDWAASLSPGATSGRKSAVVSIQCSEDSSGRDRLLP